MNQIELNDFDLDHAMLAAAGSTLLIFTGAGCAACRVARRELPAMLLPVERLGWVDAGDNPGAASRYEVFHLPAFFVIHDGAFMGEIHSRMIANDLAAAIGLALGRDADELP